MYPSGSTLSSSSVMYSKAVADYDNGYLVVGWDNGASHNLLTKVDINGNVIYSKKQSDLGTAIAGYIPEKAVVLNNHVFIGGSIYTHNLPPSGVVYSPRLVQYNPCKEVEWCLVLDELKGYITYDVAIASDDTYLCLFGEVNPISELDLYVAKVSIAGKVLWLNQYKYLNNTSAYIDNFGFEESPSIIPDTDGGFILSAGKNTVMVGKSTSALLAYWMKADSQGNRLWDTVCSTVNNEIKQGISARGIKDSDGNMYFSGMQADFPDSEFFKNRTSGFYTLTDNGGNRQINWSMLSNNPDEIPSNVLKTPQGEIILVANRWVTKEGTSLEYPQTCMYKTNVQGNVIDSIIMGTGENNDYFLVRNMINTSDGNILLSGNWSDPMNESQCPVLSKITSNFTGGELNTQVIIYDSLCPHAIQGDTVDMSSKCSSLSIFEPISKNKTIELNSYPNPSTGYVTVDIPEYSIQKNIGNGVLHQQYQLLKGEVQLSLINVSGKTVLTEVCNVSEGIHLLNISQLSSGVYMIVLTQNGNLIARGKVVVR